MNAERRGSDRRHADRRMAGGRRSDDSLFGALAGTDGASAADGSGDSSGAAESAFDPGWLASGDPRADSRFLLRQARRIVQAQDSALARVYRTYAAARAAVGVGLVLVQGMGSMIGSRGSEPLALVALVYAVQAITLWLLPRFGALAQPQPQLPQRRRQWLATIGVDLLAFTLLHLLEVGSSFSYAALLVLPVLMAGVLTARLLALGTAAGVTLMLLVAAWRAGYGQPDGPALMLQSGLAGLGLFLITVLAGELAGRLAREELAARGSLELARQQAQLNRLVIEEMADGVLVVDRRLRVRAANPAARALLVDQGLSPAAPFTLQQQPAWAALQQAVERALADGQWPDAGRDVMLGFGQGQTRTLRLRVRFMRGRGLERTESLTDEVDGEPFAVLLLEDVRTLQARIRQEKLAAMGRVSAGIAHEIRNPLAAIAQANALLLEDGLPAPQQRLAQMVADNVERLKRLVDDVMEVAPGAAPLLRAIDASATVAEAATDWARTAQVTFGAAAAFAASSASAASTASTATAATVASVASGADSRLRAELPPQPLPVVFDAEHLRRVLVNLLDNAHRHAGPLPGAIFLRLAARDDGAVLLSVLSDGAPIAPEIERYLFEPFFSTRSRGSGLGLYICRELCERYGASIEYRPRPAAERLRNEFVVSLRRAAPPNAGNAVDAARAQPPRPPG